MCAARVLCSRPPLPGCESRVRVAGLHGWRGQGACSERPRVSPCVLRRTRDLWMNAAQSCVWTESGWNVRRADPSTLALGRCS
ncbi:MULTISPECIES: HofP DNA utilization family protein [unclassified Nocardioides]|uniref:HofP DNA utilization family protein n=1 Tax=unclassified Nocardioides TaxID=2615069 RepID=UPI003FA5B3E4